MALIVPSKESNMKNYIVEDLFYPGAMFLASNPKSGKSFFALDLAFSIAWGRQFLGKATNQGSVLYLSLEDGIETLEERTFQMKERETQFIHAYEQWEGMTEGGITKIQKWIDTAYNPRCIIIDTLVDFTPEVTWDKNIYRAEKKMMTALNKFARKRNVFLLALHHYSKSGNSVRQKFSGSSGLRAGVDGMIALERSEEYADFYFEHRAYASFILRTKFNSKTMRFEETVSMNTSSLDYSSRKIYEYIEESGQTGETVAELCRTANDSGDFEKLSYNTVKNKTAKLLELGYISRSKIDQRRYISSCQENDSEMLIQRSITFNIAKEELDKAKTAYELFEREL